MSNARGLAIGMILAALTVGGASTDAHLRASGHRPAAGGWQALGRNDAPGTGHFDSYVFSLAWSPEHCRTSPKDRGSRQCSTPYGFIVHGLWPETDRGPEPLDCRDDAGPSEVVVASVLDIMPSEGLIRHEWRTHGACSGLDPAQYFSRIRETFERLTIPAPYRTARSPRVITPAVLKQEFAEANASLTADRLAVVCDGNALREVRICLDKRLAPTRCSGRVRDRCSQRTMLVLPR